MTSRYRQTMSEAMEAVRLNEVQSHTVRFLDPANGKRFAVPFKTHADAEKKMAQLKRDGVKDIKITMDTLKPGIKFKEVNEDKDHEISMARSELEAISDKALKLSSMLQSKSDEGNPLEAWVQSKITKAKDYITSVADHMEYNPDNAMEEVKEDKEYTDEELGEMFGNKQIDPTTAAALRAYLSGRAGGSPFPPVVEGMMSKIDAMQKQGASAADIAKELKLDVKTVKGILGEELDEAFSDTQIAQLKKAYEPLRDKKISIDNANKLRAMLSTIDGNKGALEKLYKADIPFVSSTASARLISKHGYKAQQLISLRKEGVDIAVEELKQINEVTKDSAYAIGMAQAKKMKGDEPPLKKSTITKGHEIAKSILKKEEKEHPAKELYEAIAAVKNKAEKTGMPYSILKQVYDRGMAAWRGGHRPGATQVQWALARVNSFVTKSSGTWGGADKDLAAKVKGE